MKASTILRCGITLKPYQDKYGTLIHPSAMSALIGLDRIHKIQVSKQEALVLNNYLIDNASYPKIVKKLYEFIVNQVETHYGQSMFPINFKNIINKPSFILSELVACGYLTEGSLENLYHYIHGSRGDISYKISTLLLYYPTEIISLLNMNIEDEILVAYLIELEKHLTIEREVNASKELVSYYVFN